MALPTARGPLSASLLEVLTGGREPRELVTATAGATFPSPLYDDDLQLTLTMLYELALQGLTGVDDRWEWDTDLLTVRARLEAPFEVALHELVEGRTPEDPNVTTALAHLTSDDGTPGLSHFMGRKADPEQWREFLVHRAVYHLREADLHTFGIPRLAGVPKAALVEVQADEYGGGRLERMHSSLFARTMRTLGLDDAYGAYIDAVPAITLASLNVMSLFGLHRRHLGALMGHLCGIEMTSSAPNRRYGNGLRRLGFDRDATLFFDEHVEADAVHEQIVGRDLAGGLAAQQPGRAADILFGCAVCLAIDELVGRHLTRMWGQGRSSLISPA